MGITMWIIITLFYYPFIKGAAGLRLTNVDVPGHANLGDNVALKCFFDLGASKLYSVKWYKDDYEFYRYMPDGEPKTRVFPLPGIHLDASDSGMNQVTLTEVEYRTSGAYKCEVSTEAPSFDAVFRGGNMTVLAYPDRPPQISGVMDIYSVGDYVTGNCSSGKSNPAPTLAWFINGFKADTWLTDKYPVLSHENGRYSRALGLRFLAEKKHFIGQGSSIKLKCSSTVADLPAQSAVVEPRLASASANQKLAQERLHNLECRCFVLLLAVAAGRVSFFRFPSTSKRSKSCYLSRWILPLCLIAWMGTT